MRRLVALGATLTALAAAVLVVAAPPASAGGPTSVLVVNYDGSRAAGALTGSAAYADLEKALDPYTPPSGERTAPSSFMGTQIRLTWMIHDVSPWRVDAVTLDGKDVWVETIVDTGAGVLAPDTPAVRHRPKDSALLLATLRSLGVLGDRQPAASSRTEDSTQAVAPPAARSSDSSGTQAGPASTGVPWWASGSAALLALGLGVGVGIGLGVGLGVVLGRRLRPVGTPRARSGEGGTAGGGTAGGGTAGGGTVRPARHVEAKGAAGIERVAPVGFTPDPDRARH